MRVMDPFCPSGIRTILHWSSSRRFHDIAPCSRTQENGLPRSHTVYSKRQCMVADLLRRASDTGCCSQCMFAHDFPQAAAVLSFNQLSSSGLGGSPDSSADTSIWIEI